MRRKKPLTGEEIDEAADWISRGKIRTLDVQEADQSPPPETETQGVERLDKLESRIRPVR